MKNTILGAICLSLAASIWGGMYVVSKYVLDFIPPLTLVWLRYIVAFLVLFILLQVQQRKTTRLRIEKKDWYLFAWIGFIGYFVSISFQFIGTRLSDAHTGALITSATPAFIVVFARWILGEAFTTRKLVSLALATLGVVIVIGWEQNVDSSLLGSLILVGAAITWALLSIYAKIATQRHTSLTVTTYAVFFALLFTTPVMLWEIRREAIHYNEPLIILGVLYLGIVSTAGAFFLWNKGLELMDAGVGSLFFFFQPIVGSFLGWLLLHEHLGVNFFVGGGFILLGVLLVTLQPETKAG
ncbi:DMT family transporter [Ammoniphilus sp. YIM 78166]|uniref:DMT family transporter n=1 Tax=Ammoniphilus sp. YIM 78166 TaxID=1644106 RepID=UPI00106F7DCE|nr:EamA family transporter [Ammoniphilus sp. YIM 78166]